MLKELKTKEDYLKAFDEKLIKITQEKGRLFKCSDDNGFPVRTQPSERDKEGIHISFGLHGQDVFDYTERLLADGAGWNQIAKAIGWIGFGVFKSYYTEKHLELFDSKGVFLLSPNADLREGCLKINKKTKLLEVVTAEEAEKTEYTSLSNVIRNVQFLVGRKSKEIFENSDKKIDVDFNMELEGEGKTVCYHVWIDNSGVKELLKSNCLQDLMSTLILMQKDNTERISPVYFDILQGVDDGCKKVISRESIEFYQEFGFK